MYKTTVVDQKLKPVFLSFQEWVKQNTNSIESHLVDAAIEFINDQGEELKVPVTHIYLDNAWHYIDKPKKKQSYRGSFHYDNDGTPWLNLVFYTFRHGGVSVKFDSKSELKSLWKQFKGETFTHTKTSLKKSVTESAPVDRVDYISKDLKAFESMNDSGASHYLKRKGLDEKHIKGIRFGKSFIAIKIIDAFGNGYGLQKIYDDGRKLFTKGLTKKGHFALIGASSLPEKLDTIHVAEGVATAATISTCLNSPVFSVLDAGNILAASRSLKKHYPKANIIIWADNDWQKQDKVTPNGRVLGNTGLIMANHAAFKLRNAHVCAPDFSKFTKDKVQSATDFNDLFMIEGERAILNAKPQKPDVSLALFHDLRKYKALNHGRLSPTNFKSAKKITYNTRFLPCDILDTDGVHLVRSAIGTGKTEIIANLLKNNPDVSMLFTTHLISLVESAASRLNLVSYHDCDNYDLQMERQVAICLNSLGKLTAEGNPRAYDVVVIDEIEQVLARLTTDIANKPLIMAVIEFLLKNAKKVICLDADLSDRSAHIIQSFCADKPVTIHFNEYEMGSAKEIVLYEAIEDLQMSALSAIESGQKAFLAFNSKTEAKKTYCAYQMMVPEKKGLLISGDNAGEKEVTEFFNDVNAACRQYDYVICTPSVSTGVSIDNDYFDFVGGVFSAQINTANDCMQALGRVRNQKKVHVFCEKRMGAKSLSPEVIASRWSSTHHYDLHLMSLNPDGEKILINPVYERLNVLVTQAKNASFNDFYQSFCLIALNDGAKFSYSPIALDKEFKSRLKAFKKEVILESAKVDETVILSASELKTLANKSRKTMEETLLFKRQHIIDFYKLSPHDKDSIEVLSEIDNDGRFRKNILNLELAIADESLAKKRFVSQFEEGAKFAADLNHFAVLQMLLKKLFVALNIEFDGSELKPLDSCYDNQSLLESGFIDWVESKRSVLQGVISIPSKDFLYNNPLSFISQLLQKVGLKQKRVGRASKGMYQLNPERLKLINGVLAKRAGGITSNSVVQRQDSVKPKSCAGQSLLMLLDKVKSLCQTSIPTLAPSIA